MIINKYGGAVEILDAAWVRSSNCDDLGMSASACEHEFLVFSDRRKSAYSFSTTVYIDLFRTPHDY